MGAAFREENLKIFRRVSFKDFSGPEAILGLDTHRFPKEYPRALITSSLVSCTPLAFRADQSTSQPPPLLAMEDTLASTLVPSEEPTLSQLLQNSAPLSQRVSSMSYEQLVETREELKSAAEPLRERVDQAQEALKAAQAELKAAQEALSPVTSDLESVERALAKEEHKSSRLRALEETAADARRLASGSAFAQPLGTVVSRVLANPDAAAGLTLHEPGSVFPFKDHIDVEGEQGRVSIRAYQDGTFGVFHHTRDSAGIALAYPKVGDKLDSRYFAMKADARAAEPGLSQVAIVSGSFTSELAAVPGEPPPEARKFAALVKDLLDHGSLSVNDIPVNAEAPANQTWTW